jgi:hypothetical protein
LYVVQATSVKFGLHVGNMIFNTQNEEWINTSLPTIKHIILPVHFSTHYAQ